MHYHRYCRKLFMFSIVVLLSLVKVIVCQYDDFCLPAIICSAAGLSNDNLMTPDDNVACPTMSTLIMTTVGRVVNQYAYAHGLIPALERAPYQEFVKSGASQPRLGLCDYDCDDDDQCAPGLWCADDHKEELRRAGYDNRKANCGNVGGQFEEVCFDKRLLTNRTRLLTTSEDQADTNIAQVVTGTKATFREEKRTRLGAQKKRALRVCSCSDRCAKPRAGTRCQWLSCGACKSSRRRLQLSNENISKLLRLAESQMRTIASTWSNITDPGCKDYLLSATCAVTSHTT